MNIIVLIKQVPDMEKVKFDREKGVVDRSSAGTEINPFDLNALEAAVHIVENAGGKVTALTMGPPKAEEALREAIARGANEGILLSDRLFGGADTKATSLTLVQAIKKIGEYDLILCGEKTVDGDTGQVGAEVAEFLDIPHAYYVDEILETEKDSIKVISNIWGGRYIKKIKLPALLSVTKDLNTPRLPSLRSKMLSKKAVIEKWGMEELKNFSGEFTVGLNGSPTMVKKIEVPKEVQRTGKVYKGNIDESIEAVLNFLVEKKVLEG